MSTTSPSGIPETSPKIDFEAIVAAADAQQEYRAKAMPTEKEALTVLTQAFHRLKELGWRDACYAPIDHRELRLIEAGSSGIHTGTADERPASTFPTKWFWIQDAGDLWPSHPILFKEGAKP